MSKSNATVTLTRRTIDAVTPAASRSVFWDSDVPGFGVRIESSGLKSFLIRYRVGEGGRGAPRKQMVLGRYGALSPDDARKLARQVLNAVAKGDDPAGNRHKRRKEMTVADVLDRYLAEHVSAHNKPSTATEVRRQVEQVLKPAFGRIKISDLSRSHIKQWHATLAHKPYDANRALAYLRKALSLAANDWEIRPDNPAAGIKMFREIARERFFSDAELSKIGDALRELEDKGGYTCCLRTASLAGAVYGSAKRITEGISKRIYK